MILLRPSKHVIGLNGLTTFPGELGLFFSANYCGFPNLFASRGVLVSTLRPAQWAYIVTALPCLHYVEIFAPASPLSNRSRPDLYSLEKMRFGWFLFLGLLFLWMPYEP